MVRYQYSFDTSLGRKNSVLLRLESNEIDEKRNGSNVPPRIECLCGVNPNFDLKRAYLPLMTIGSFVTFRSQGIVFDF